MKRRNVVDEVMAEHITMPGVPGMIVTRDFLYQFLVDHGWPKNERGFGSIDYLVFGRCLKPVEMPLTDVSLRDDLLSQISEAYQR